MMRVPVDPPGARKKLNFQWIKAIWVGRGESNDAHCGLTEIGIAMGKTARRLTKELSFDQEFLNKVQGEVGGNILSQRQLLNLAMTQQPTVVLTSESNEGVIVGESNQQESRDAMEVT